MDEATDPPPAADPGIDQLLAYHDGINVLVTEPDLPAPVDRCLPLCVGAGAADRLAVVVDFHRGPEAWAAAWRRRYGEPPPQTQFIAVGLDGSVAPSTADGDGLPAGLTVTHLEDPSDIGTLGRAAIHGLRAVEGGARPSLCVHSVNALLAYVDLERVFYFLALLGSFASDEAAVSHFHYRPADHDATLNRIVQSPFDVVIDAETSLLGDG